jgi:hypothetical protein
MLPTTTTKRTQDQQSDMAEPSNKKARFPRKSTSPSLEPTTTSSDDPHPSDTPPESSFADPPNDSWGHPNTCPPIPKSDTPSNYNPLPNEASTQANTLELDFGLDDPEFLTDAATCIYLIDLDYSVAMPDIHWANAWIEKHNGPRPEEIMMEPSKGFMTIWLASKADAEATLLIPNPPWGAFSPTPPSKEHGSYRLCLIGWKESVSTSQIKKFFGNKVHRVYSNTNTSVATVVFQSHRCADDFSHLRTAEIDGVTMSIKRPWTASHATMVIIKGWPKGCTQKTALLALNKLGMNLNQIRLKTHPQYGFCTGLAFVELQSLTDKLKWIGKTVIMRGTKLQVLDPDSIPKKPRTTAKDIPATPPP